MISTSTFISKLRQCNDRIYIDIKNTTYNTNKEQGTCGVYKTLTRREQFNLSDVETEHLAHAKKHNESDVEYICYVGSHYIPEVNEYSDTGAIISPGLRELLQKLVKENYLTTKQVSKYFGKTYLTRSWWDVLNNTQKKQIRLKEKE